MNKRGEGEAADAEEIAEQAAKVAEEEAAENITKDAAESMAKVAKPFYRRPAVIGSLVGIFVIPAATYVLYELFMPEAEPVFDN